MKTTKLGFVVVALGFFFQGNVHAELKAELVVTDQAVVAKQKD